MPHIEAMYTTATLEDGVRVVLDHMTVEAHVGHCLHNMKKKNVRIIIIFNVYIIVYEIGWHY